MEILCPVDNGGEMSTPPPPSSRFPPSVARVFVLPVPGRGRTDVLRTWQKFPTLMLRNFEDQVPEFPVWPLHSFAREPPEVAAKSPRGSSPRAERRRTTRPLDRTGPMDTPSRTRPSPGRRWSWRTTCATSGRRRTDGTTGAKTPSDRNQRTVAARRDSWKRAGARGAASPGGRGGARKGGPGGAVGPG